MAYYVVSYDKLAYRYVQIFDNVDGKVSTISWADTIKILNKGVWINGVVLRCATLIFNENMFISEETIKLLQNTIKQSAVTYSNPPIRVRRDDKIISKPRPNTLLRVNQEVTFDDCFSNFRGLQPKLESLYKTNVLHGDCYQCNGFTRNFKDEQYKPVELYCNIYTISNISLNQLQSYISKYSMGIMNGTYRVPRRIVDRSKNLKELSNEIVNRELSVIPIIVNMHTSSLVTSFRYAIIEEDTLRKELLYKHIWSCLESAGLINADKVLFIEKRDYTWATKFIKQVPLDTPLLVFNIVQTGKNSYIFVISLLKLQSLKLSYLQMIAYTELGKVTNFSFLELLQGWKKDANNTWVVKQGYDVHLDDDNYSLRDELQEIDSNLIKPVYADLKSNFSKTVGTKKLKVPKMSKSDKELLGNITRNEDKNIEKAMKNTQKKKTTKKKVKKG